MHDHSPYFLCASSALLHSLDALPYSRTPSYLFPRPSSLAHSSLPPAPPPPLHPGRCGEKRFHDTAFEPYSGGDQPNDASDATVQGLYELRLNGNGSIDSTDEFEQFGE